MTDEIRTRTHDTPDAGRADAASARDREASFHARLYAMRSDDRDIGIEALDTLSPAEDELLWIDLQCEDDTSRKRVFEALRMPHEASVALSGNGTNPILGKADEVFWVRVVAVDPDAEADLAGQVLWLAAGRNWVLTLHAEPIAFLEQLRARESLRSDIGQLGSESFVAALLDWQLSTYFDAVANYEAAVERLEVDILFDRPRDCMPELRRLRKDASRLRRMLAPHRAVFDALSRPDFRPTLEKAGSRHLAELDNRFERALDFVEGTRDLVIGSFSLLTSQASLRTNNAMRTLTFATVVTGVLAVIAGVLGMNFDASFFRTSSLGFAIAATSMALFAAGALWLGKRHRWY